jgi:AcrR family transcriptional regulator
MEFNEKQLSIINAAERLFSVKGFDGTSVRDIAHEASVNVAMISYYFGSKERLMEAVFEEKTKKMRLKVENLLAESNMTAHQKVNILIEDYVEKFLSQPNFHRIMMLEQITDKPGVVAGFIHELKKKNLVSIRRLITEGQKKGEFKKNVDLVLMMNTIIGIVSQMMITKRFYIETNNLEHLTEAEYNNYLRKKLTTYLKNLFKVILTNEA